MDFHETKQGQIFFNVQLPQLIQSIQKLTDALSHPGPAVSLPIQADDDFLSELYLGNYEAEVFNPAFVDHDLTQAAADAYNALAAAIPEHCRDMLEKYADTLAEKNGAVSELAYESGFRTAVQMIAAGLSAPVPRKGKGTGVVS